jgi:hypothetical protein
MLVGQSFGPAAARLRGALAEKAGGGPEGPPHRHLYMRSMIPFSVALGLIAAAHSESSGQ